MPIGITNNTTAIKNIQLDKFQGEIWEEKTKKTSTTIDFEEIERKRQAGENQKQVVEDKKSTKVTLERKGLMPMPIEVKVILNDNSEMNYYIPLQIMRGEKKQASEVIQLKDWAWAYPSYEFEIEKNKTEIKSISINPSAKMADINELNDTYTVTK